MIYFGKYNILKTKITACDYDYVIKQIDNAIKSKTNLLISPIASQTLVKSYFDHRLNSILCKFDYIVPDGQWVRYAINSLYDIDLKKRVYAVELFKQICLLSVKRKYKIFLYGTTIDTLDKLTSNLKNDYKGIKIIGSSPSVFRPLKSIEKKRLINQIHTSNPEIILVGLGSPLHELFSYQVLFNTLKDDNPKIIICMGAAFDVISGVKKQAPFFMRRSGLESLYRLIQEPKRLWKRYLVYGPVYIALIVLQKIKIIKV